MPPCSTLTGNFPHQYANARKLKFSCRLFASAARPTCETFAISVQTLCINLVASSSKKTHMARARTVLKYSKRPETKLKMKRINEFPLSQLWSSQRRVRDLLCCVYKFKCALVCVWMGLPVSPCAPATTRVAAPNQTKTLVEPARALGKSVWRRRRRRWWRQRRGRKSAAKRVGLPQGGARRRRRRPLARCDPQTHTLSLRHAVYWRGLLAQSLRPFLDQSATAAAVVLMKRLLQSAPLQHAGPAILGVVQLILNARVNNTDGLFLFLSRWITPR